MTAPLSLHTSTGGHSTTLLACSRSIALAAHPHVSVCLRFYSIQQGLFQMVTNRILEDVQKVSGKAERKICALGMTRLLTETPELMASYAHVWPQLLVAIVKLLELPQETTASDDIGDIDPDLEGEPAAACLRFVLSIIMSPPVTQYAASTSMLRVRRLPGDVRPACLCWQAKARPLP